MRWELLLLCSYTLFSGSSSPAPWSLGEAEETGRSSSSSRRMMAMTGTKGMISALLMVGVVCGRCKKQIEENPPSMCLQKHPQSNPMCSLWMVEETYRSSAKTIELITHCNHGDSYMSGLDQFGVDSCWDVSPKVVCVDEFGAKGDGYTDDTKAFNLWISRTLMNCHCCFVARAMFVFQAFKKAWKKACSLAPSVFLVLQGKKYLVKPAKFSGPCPSALTVQISGTIIAPENPSVWDGLKTRLWLRFHGVKNLTVEGGGRIYGSGGQWWARSCKINKTNPCRSAPTSTAYKFKKCFGVEANNLKVTAPGHSPNTNGIHISASTYVVIKNSIIETGDDCNSIVNGSFHVQIENITCGSGHGISIGSLGKLGTGAYVSNVIVDGAFLHGTTNGLRIKTWQKYYKLPFRIISLEGGSGFARGITFQNVHIDNVSHPIIIDQYYCDSRKPCPRKVSLFILNKIFVLL